MPNKHLLFPHFSRHTHRARERGSGGGEGGAKREENFPRKYNLSPIPPEERLSPGKEGSGAFERTCSTVINVIGLGLRFQRRLVSILLPLSLSLSFVVCGGSDRQRAYALSPVPPVSPRGLWELSNRILSVLYFVAVRIDRSPRLAPRVSLPREVA